MVTQGGVLFHIDFGFVLGRDPKLIAPHIRLTPTMVDALGGGRSDSFLEFKKLCSNAFNCLRRHVGLFTSLLILLADLQPTVDNFTRDEIIDQILNRFMPGLEEDEAGSTFNTLLDSAWQSYGGTVVDVMHDRRTVTSDVSQGLRSLASAAASYLWWSSSNE